MNKQRIKTMLMIVVIITLAGCSTQKNTPAARSYHQTKCKYNINFNATNSYIEGMKLINASQHDDYTQLLPMFPIAVKANQTIATSQMDNVILKCRKSIKLHSITRKPPFDASKKKDPKYMYFYNQEEYIKGVKDAWILLGKAQIQKGDFMGAIASFNYIERHYPSDIRINCEAKIWNALAYQLAGWPYEAEQSLDAIKPDNLPSSLTQDYSAIKASVYLDEKRYDEALPFLKIAVDKEHERLLKARWSFILGQLYFNKGNKQEAEHYLDIAVKRSQDYQLEFNARLLLLQCNGDKLQANIKRLDRMAKNYNNKDYLDQVYCTKGNMLLAHGDTAKAIEAYLKGVEKSTRQGAEKASLLITLADLYYSRKQYIEAQPHYAEAVNLVQNTHPDYTRISRLAQTLGQLAQYKNTVDLQDSLQMLSTMTEQEQRIVVDSIIARAKREAAAEEKIMKEEAENGFQETERLDMSRQIGSQEWYFYNQQLINKGATTFRQKWGNRRLEDNWRRSSKMASAFSSDNDDGDKKTDDMAEGKDDKKKPEDKKSENSEKEGAEDDDGEENPMYDPEYYLAQIPHSPEDIETSNAQISDALYKMAVLYDDELKEYRLAQTTHEEFQSRFPRDSFNLESLYSCYRLGHKLKDDEMIQNYREQIIRRYPQSSYAMMLTDSNYVERMMQMLKVQDSIYRLAYQDFRASNFARVRRAYTQMKQNYPTATLLPKFALLDALAVGKSGKQSDFVAALQDVVATYPKADVASTCRDLLALMKQGEKAKTGKNDNTIEKMRDKADEDEGPQEFTYDDESTHALVIVLGDETQKQAYSTLYDMAAYNFTHFMVNTYDLEVRTIEGHQAIIVTEFQTRKEAEWYFAKLKDEAAISASDFVIISKDDLSLIGKLKTLSEYKKENSKPAKRH